MKDEHGPSPRPWYEDEAPMGEMTWHEIGAESGRLFAIIMCGLSLGILATLLVPW